MVITHDWCAAVFTIHDMLPSSVECELVCTVQQNWALWTGYCGLYEYSNHKDKPGTYTVEYDHCIVQFIMDQFNVTYFYICVGSVNHKWLPEFLQKFGSIKVMQMRLKKPHCVTVMSKLCWVCPTIFFFYTNNFVCIPWNMGEHLLLCLSWSLCYRWSSVIKSGQC